MQVIASIRSRSGPNQPSSFAAPTNWAGLLQLHWVWNRGAAQPLREHPFLSNSAASASSTLAAVLAFEARTFQELCNVRSLDGGFSEGTTGNILTSRQPRTIQPIGLRGCCVSTGGSALRRGGTYYATRCGCRYKKIGLRGGHKKPRNKVVGLVSRERFLDAHDGKACRTLAAGSNGSKQPSSLPL
jgi:hypothetical protein